MNRRGFVKGLVGAGVVAMMPNMVLGSQKVVEPESVGSLFGNAEEFLPQGESDSVEVVLTSFPLEQRGHQWSKLGMVIQNNSDSTIYLSDVEGMVRDDQGTPLATVFSTLIAPAVLQPGEYSLVDVTLDAGIDDPESAAVELNPVWEVFEDVREPMFTNVSVEEAVVNDSGQMIGTLLNDSGENYEYSVWHVVALCFDEDGNIVTTGSSMDTATPSFIDGGTQTYSAIFSDGEPTERFLVAAVTSLWG